MFWHSQKFYEISGKFSKLTFLSKTKRQTVGKTCVLDPYSQNPDPDPAKNLNPDPSYFLTLSEKKLKLHHNYKI